MIALALGQSNSANFGETRYRPKREAYSYYRGRLYRAEDPLPGAECDRGSVWTRLADLLVESGMYERVVFVTIGIGSTTVECWAESGCCKYLKETLEDLNAHNVRLTHIFWHQGEQDSYLKTGSATYKKNMAAVLRVLRGYGQEAPVYVSLASYSPLVAGGICSEVRRGQVEFINENPGVLAGPDTDSLISEAYRYDGVHFSDAGLDVFAELWFKAIAESAEVVKIN